LTTRQLLFTAAGRVRAPWRIGAFVVATFVWTYVAAVFVGPIFQFVFRITGVAPLSTAEWIQAVGLIAATAFCLRLIDKEGWRLVWMGREAAAPSKLAAGWVIGALGIALPIAVLIAARWLAPEAGTSGSWAAAATRLSLFLLPAALLEELATRGYIFAVLRDVWGWRWTVVVTSLGFGLLHLANAGASVRSVLLVVVAGLMLGGVLVATRSLYAAWMAHFAWNWTMAVVFHTAVSGLPLDAPGYRYVDAGPDWATGGVWGPEGGVPAGIGMGGGALAAYLLARRRSKRQMES
jgi:membrane protease YdiL (CAAX protease family)